VRPCGGAQRLVCGCLPAPSSSLLFDCQRSPVRRAQLGP
jgi:hypothetical protein